MVRIQGLAGRFPDALRIGRLQVADARGVYVTIDNAVLDWSPTRLTDREALVDQLTADRVSLARLPESSSSNSQSGGTFNLPVRVVLRQLRVAHLDVAAAVAQHPVSLSVEGAGELDTLEQGHVRLAAQRLDGAGTYDVTGRLDPARIQATVQVREPPHGLIAGLANVPEVGAIAIDVSVDGPRDALATSLAISADPLRATASGTIDLTGQSAALTVTADAPAMSPRPDLVWQSVHLDAKVNGPFLKPDASGTLRIAGLSAAGASIGTLTADLSGNAGAVQLHAQLYDLRVPGPKPDLLAGDPLMLDATARLDAPDRPVTFAVHHKLLALEGTAQTGGAIQAKASLSLPDLAPFAAAGGTDLQGHADLNLIAAEDNGSETLAVQGSVGITGGMAPVPALVGDAAKLDVAANLHGQDIALTRLAVNGKAFDVSANGGFTGGRIALNWAAHLADLTVLQPNLAGQLAAQGSANGPTSDLAVKADLTGDIAGQGYKSGTITAHVEAQGLPSAPTAHLTAQGTLLDSPLAVALVADRTAGTLHLSIDKADWKSLHADGSVSLAASETVPTGKLTLSMTRLADLAPFLGQPIAGSVTASLDADPQAARVNVVIQGVSVPGTASVAKATVTATVSGPADKAPQIDGTATVDGVSVAGTTGSARLTAKGPADALAIRVTADAANLMGSAARLDTAGTVNGTAKTLDLTALHADWKQQSLRLVDPVKVAFSNGVSLGTLRLALGRATVEVSGHTGPTLDLTASLRNLPADLAAMADPAMAADGTIGAEAHLTGSTAHPAGTIRVTATGVRLRQGAGRALPAANLTASATLTGTAADLDTRLTAGASHLTLTGSAPLSKDGALNLRTAGTVDLVMLDPILASEGRRVRGQVTLEAAIAGTTAAPRITGTARLARGDVQDVALGAHISDLAATIEASGDTVRITQFTGKAGEGSVGVSGTVGVGGAMPIDLKLTASNARPLSSDLLTAVLDANLTVQGEVAGDITLGGLLHVRRADIRVPEKLPPSVAVLPVRVAGAPPPAPAPPAPEHVIALNLTLDAPQQVFVRGRGLDAELGGTIHIHGTSSNPQPDGGLQLRRGTFSLAGQTLTFTSGSFTFTGAGITDPSLNLVATSTAATMVATLTVSGSAKDPKITLSSVPDAPQDEILAQLLFQSTTAKLSPFQIAEIGAALASLSGAPSAVADPLGSIRSALGLDRLSVGSSSTGNPTVEGGSYVARGVYVGAKQSASGTGTQATVQVDLAKGLKFETTAGSGSSTATGAASSADAASLGLTYQFEY
jgi:translocation and assembly module TamB